MRVHSGVLAVARVASLFFGLGCGGNAIVAKLRYDEVPPAPEEAFRATPPDSSPVPLVASLSWRETTLPNGMHVVLLERHELPIVSIFLAAARGYADAGVSLDTWEVFARMIGTASTRSNPSEFSAAWELLASGLTRIASVDGCGLSTRVGAADLNQAVGLIADTVVHPRFDPQRFVLERQNWRQRFDNNGNVDAALARVTASLLYGETEPYGFKKPSLAHTESIGLSDVSTIFARIFQPAQTTLIVVGDATPAAVDAIAGAAFADFTSTAPPFPRSGAPPPREAGPHTAIVRRGDREQTYVAVLARLGPLLPAEMATAEVLSRALTGISSTLHHAIRDDLGSAYSFGASVRFTRSMTSIGFLGPIQATKAAATLRATISAIRGARAGGLDADAVERARSGLVADFRARVSTNQGLTGMAAFAVTEDSALSTIASYPERISAVTAAAVRALAERSFTDDALRVAVIGNTKQMGDFVSFAPVVWWNGFAEHE